MKQPVLWQRPSRHYIQKMLPGRPPLGAQHLYSFSFDISLKILYFFLSNQFLIFSLFLVNEKGDFLTHAHNSILIGLFHF